MKSYLLYIIVIIIDTSKSRDITGTTHKSGGASRAIYGGRQNPSQCTVDTDCDSSPKCQLMCACEGGRCRVQGEDPFSRANECNINRDCATLDKCRSKIFKFIDGKCWKSFALLLTFQINGLSCSLTKYIDNYIWLKFSIKLREHI